jgi:hypothetical protein
MIPILSHSYPDCEGSPQEKHDKPLVHSGILGEETATGRNMATSFESAKIHFAANTTDAYRRQDPAGYNLSEGLYCLADGLRKLEERLGALEQRLDSAGGARPRQG